MKQIDYLSNEQFMQLFVSYLTYEGIYLINQMNEYEISKLKKELLRKNEVIKQMKDDLAYVENQLVTVQAERDKYHGQLQIARQTIQNVDQIIDQKVREMKTKLEHENATSLNELQTLRNRLIEEKNLNQKYNEQIRNKDAVISQLSLRLRQMSIKYKDPSLQVNVKQISEQASITYNQFYKLTEKYNSLSQNMENIMAENKILRKLHGVPDNFGFDLEEIKIAEKQELEDYKAQCRKLQTQIQQLQAERTQLRYRLRQYNTLYSNKGQRYKDLTQRQLQLLDAYALNLKEGKDQLPQIDKSQKQMEREIIRLRAQVQVLQSKSPMGIFPSGTKTQNTNNQMSKDSFKKLQQQMRDILNPFVQDIKKLSQTNINAIIQNVQNIQVAPNNEKSSTIQGQPGNISGLRPPQPLPIANNDWSSIKQGYSYRYSCKIPVDLKDFEGDISFDTIRSKYQIAALQLQNIESLKMLKQKQDQQKIIKQELNDLKQKFKKCLLIQDDLFVKYFKMRDEFKENVKQSDIQKRRITDQRDSLRVQVATLNQALHALSTKTQLQRKFKEFGERLAKSEAGMIKSQRKYQIIFDEHQFLRDSYTKMQLKAAQNETYLKEKYLTARMNEKQLTLLMNQVLEQTKDSVSCDTHNILLSKMETLNDKYANFAFKQSELRMKISRLESVEREMNIKDEIIQYLRQDKLDLLLELQIIRNRLKAIDGNYREGMIIFENFVGFINSHSISLMECFKKFDRDNSGTLTKNQLKSALSTFDFHLTNDKYELLYSQFDLDGSGTVNYAEFIRKLKRGGAVSRSKDEQAIYLFFKAIKNSKISIKNAFQIVDKDGSGYVSKSELESAFHQIGIECDSKTIDAIFRLTDFDMDNKLQCRQLEQLYNDIVRQTEIDEYELKPELDWKYEFILRLEESTIKNNITLEEAFNKLDDDNNKYMTINELSLFLTKIKVFLERKFLEQLFNFMDIRYDGKIQYAQLLKLLDDAKKQKRKVQRLLAVQRRAEQLRKENEIMSKQMQPSKATEQGIQKIRLMALQTKQSNLVKKNEKLCKSLANKEQQIKDLQNSITENQKQLMAIQDKYTKQRQVNITLQQKMKNFIGQQQAKKLKHEHQKIKIQNCQYLTQLETYKGLFTSLTDKNKMQLMSVQKIKAQLNKHYDIVKQLQAQNISKAELGRLALELEYSKRNEQIVNKKYEDICDQTKTLAKENNGLSNQSLDKQKEIVNTHLLMRQKTNLLQKSIDSLTAKILPTITVSKIDEIISKLRQMSSSKSELEEQNKVLREKNFSLQLKYDHIEIERVNLQELQKKLRKTYTDPNSIALIDVTKQLSDYKINELKLKREYNLLKEKQQYYMRINNANTDNIKELQNQLGKWEIKYNEREQFWRKRMADQMKLADQIHREVQKTKEQQIKAVKYFNNKQIQEEKIENDYELLSQGRKATLSQLAKPPSVYRQMGKNSEKVEQLNLRIGDLTQQLNEKEKQIYRLKMTLQDIIPEQRMRFSTIGSQIGGNIPTNSFLLQTQLTTSQLKNNAKRFLNSQKQQQVFFKEEAERMAQAAQQSIDTLQRIIDDKNEQLRRKQKIIDELKRDLLKNKEEDCYQIQKLNEEIRQLRSKGQIASLNQIMNKSTNKQFYPANGNNQEQRVRSLMQMIQQKEVDIRNWQKKYNELYINKSKVKAPQNPKNKIAEDKVRELLQERQNDKNRYIQAQSKLKQKIKNLEKLIKQKDTKFSQLNKAFLELKQSLMKEKQQISQSQVEGNEQFILQMNQGKSANDSKMEVMLQRALQTVQTMTKKNKEYEIEIKRLRQAQLNRTSRR